MHPAARGGLACALAAAGVASGVATVVLHQRWWGLALGLGAGLAATAALPAGWSGRVAFVAGWTATVGLATSTRGEGDYLVPGNVPGYALLVVSLALMVAALVTLPPARRGGRSAVDQEDPPATA